MLTHCGDHFPIYAYIKLLCCTYKLLQCYVSVRSQSKKILKIFGNESWKLRTEVKVSNIKTKTIGIGRKLLEGGQRAENRENRILKNIIF